METKPILTIAAVIISLTAGALISGIYFQTRIKQLKEECASNKTENLSSVPRISSLPNFPQIATPPDEVLIISGKVEKIEGSNLTVKALFYGREKTYLVKIANSTKLIEREMIANPPPPEPGKSLYPFTEREIKLTDIGVGDNIIAEASENIKDKTEFEAKTIDLTVMPAVPTAPATAPTP